MATPSKKRLGRPPSGKALTETERKRRQRARLKATGGRQFNVVLDPSAVDALLVCIGAHGGVTVSQLVGQLLTREAQRLKA